MKVRDATTTQPSTDRESRATAAINQLLQVWESGDLPRHIEHSTIRRQAGSIRPCDSWSLGNQLLMLLAGTDDARGFRQWEQVGRRVRKGERAFFIFAPCTRKVEDPDPAPGQQQQPTERLIITGVRLVPVFAVESTDGSPIDIPDCSPVQLPPLLEVAEAWGIDVRYAPFTGAEYGYYQPGAQRIVLKTHDELTFFHELAQAAHDRIERLRPGQIPSQEIVAEAAGAALCLIWVRAGLSVGGPPLRRRLRRPAAIRGPESRLQLPLRNPEGPRADPRLCRELVPPRLKAMCSGYRRRPGGSVCGVPSAPAQILAAAFARPAAAMRQQRSRNHRGLL